MAKTRGRGRRSAITALARKLLVALWKYVNAGVQATDRLSALASTPFG